MALGVALLVGPAKHFRRRLFIMPVITYASLARPRKFAAFARNLRSGIMWGNMKAYD